MTIENWLESSRCPRLPISKILKDLITRLNNVILYSIRKIIISSVFYLIIDQSLPDESNY